MTDPVDVARPVSGEVEKLAEWHEERARTGVPFAEYQDTDGRFVASDFHANSARLIRSLEASQEGLVEALEDVADPMRKLKRDADAKGAVLNGYAHTIANDAYFIKGIAKDALAALTSPDALDDREAG